MAFAPATPVQAFWTQDMLLLGEDQVTPLCGLVPPVGSTPSEQEERASKARVFTLIV
jgi:hypothetical protein